VDRTIQFLWDRREQARSVKKSTEWAIHLLESGFDSEAIVRLATITEGNWDWEAGLVEQALRDIGQHDLLQDRYLLPRYEAEVIADYYGGLINGQELIQIGFDLYFEAENRPEIQLGRFWLMLAADSDQNGGNGICHRYRFDLLPFDEALRQALAANGFPPPV
jgi:hypothetical protein